MIEQIKISIIIPAYNVERYISECINSLLIQSYKNLEIIIVNDGSKDKTRDLVDELAKKDKRIKIIHKSNGGSSAARNSGLRVATGDCIMFLDSDDWLDKDACLIAVEELLNNSVDLVIFEYLKEFNNKTIIHRSYNRQKIIYNKNNKNNFFIYDMRTITVWGKLYSRKCLEGFFFNENMKIVEDVDFNFRIYDKLKSAIYIQRPLLHYRILQKSAAHGYDSKIMEKFAYPLEQIYEYMVKYNSSGEKCEAYYSFAAIAYLVMCQNGICLNKELNMLEKLIQIKKMRNNSYIQELFLNIKNIRIPFSRKLLIIFGKIGFEIGILGVIAIKQKVEKMR